MVGFSGLDVDDPQRWVEATLSSSGARFKVVVAHHPLAGAAADDANSAYGRGGAAAARLGSQSELHRVMLRHGVQAFIHGHDHVFNDEVSRIRGGVWRRFGAGRGQLDQLTS